jgi:hypothetical protein
MALFLTVLKWLGTSLLNPKVLAALAVLGLLAYGQWHFYDWSYARGVASQTKAMDTLKGKMAALQKDDDATHTSLNGWISKYNQFVKDSDKTIGDLKLSFASTEADLTKQLQATQTALDAKNKELINETQKYVTASADAHCTIPLGFVQLYDLSIEGIGATPGTTSASALALAQPPFATVDFPSGLSLSDVTSVIVINNAAAVTNRNLVIGWQQWWNSVKADYQKAQQSASASLPSPQASLLTAPKGTFTDESVQRPPLAQIQNR